MRFQWRDGSRVRGITAEAAAKRIEFLRKRLKRDVRPDDILKDAKHADSPLHPAFDWDDSVAAQKWRIHQAGHILMSVEIVPKQGDDEGEPVRAFVRVQRGESKPAYCGIVEAMNDPSIKEQLMRTLESEAKNFADRARRYKRFAKIVEAIDEVVS